MIMILNMECNCQTEFKVLEILVKSLVKHSIHTFQTEYIHTIHTETYIQFTLKHTYNSLDILFTYRLTCFLNEGNINTVSLNY